MSKLFAYLSYRPSSMAGGDPWRIPSR